MKMLMFLVLALASSSAFALNPDPEVESGNAVNNCRAAQTFRDVGVRSRPLALVNETNPGTFINCAYRISKKDGSWRFGGVIHNYGNTPVTINCTGVHGVDNGDAEYFTRSVDVPAGARRYVEWRRDQGYESNVAFQCYLPPNIGLNEIEILK